MKRRSFLKNVSLGGFSSFMVGSGAFARAPHSINTFNHSYDSLNDWQDEHGQIAVRLMIHNPDSKGYETIDGQCSIKKGKVSRIKHYFFDEGLDQLQVKRNKAEFTLIPHDPKIIVIWLREYSEQTTIHFGDGVEVSISELVNNHYVDKNLGAAIWSLNLLGYKETGKINLLDMGIDADDASEFVIMADPQGGDYLEPTNESNTRIQIHNAFIKESVRLVNEHASEAAFTLVLGDITDSKGQKKNFDRMLEMLGEVKTPLLFEIGNHETKYSARFSKGYDLEPFDNYFTAQHQTNGMDKLLYSFDIGQWHIIVWPDPLRRGFWQTRPHYYDWLEQDLEANKNKPVMFLQHVPIHPIGIDPLINYSESIRVKNTLFELLSQHGNVKYVFSGHVHIPLKSCFKIACEYKGIKFFNLPAAGYRPRSFGEADFLGGPSQGITKVKLDGTALDVEFIAVTNQKFSFPSTLWIYDEGKYPLLLKEKWQLPVNSNLLNGSFKHGLDQWHKRFVYQEDENPSNICQSVIHSNKTCLYLFSRKRSYDTPGQDRWPQSSNHICQSVSWNGLTGRMLTFNYMIEYEKFDSDYWSGFYVWLEGFSKSVKMTDMIYGAGKLFTWMAGGSVTGTKSFNISGPVGKWNNVSLNIPNDFNLNSKERNFASLEIDRIIINIGVWTANDKDIHSIGVYLTDIDHDKKVSESSKSHVNNKMLIEFHESDIWQRRNRHIAGEHNFVPAG